MAAASAADDDISISNISEANVETPLLASNNDVVEGYVDYRGRPARRPDSGGWGSAFFIIGVEVGERFAFYGISANLVTYLTGRLGQSTATAAENVNAWSGAAQLLPVLGALIADSFLGRYRTIILASVLYIFGLGFLTVSAILPPKLSNCRDTSNAMICSPPQIQVIIFFVSLYLVAIAQGMHRPCVQAFGAEQFDAEDPGEAKAKSSFFNWWSFIVNIAITATFMVLSYIEENLSWGLGFGIPCLVIGFALILFFLGTATYRFHATSHKGSPLQRLGWVLMNAARNWRNSSSAKYMEEGNQKIVPFLGSQEFKFQNNSLVVSDDSMEEREDCNIKKIEEAKAILRLFPILVTCMIYGIVCSQSSTLFIKQGATMDRSIGATFEVPAASLQSFISLSVVVFVAIYDCILVPLARAVTGKPSGLTVLQRIGAGLFISILNMVTAALVETKRLRTAQMYGLVEKPEATVPMSVLWLIPQYMLLGVSEVFAMVGLQEFSYDEMPAELKSTGLSLYLCVFGIGSFISSFLISVIEKITSRDGGNSWFSDNLNQAHLDYFYLLLAGLSAAAFTGFLFAAKSYVYNASQT
ncbi:OLC1v1015751C1 [Oldenlandia corymbosa var. corymbosa]|uniref:OLC1v1015751C1 n=1 Tax=Oldenlandia corymbosa var. corymbosa TaxID=529605 RepID=A0AAV1E463_OLDCO|nr:OLC1v1015751C1 [Oldenlandia corymbosa var. corymbosa]